MFIQANNQHRENIVRVASFFSMSTEWSRRSRDKLKMNGHFSHKDEIFFTLRFLNCA